MKVIDIAVDDIPVRIVHRSSTWDSWVNDMCDVQIDGQRVLVLYKPTEEQMIAKIRKAIEATKLPNPRCPNCGDRMLVHSLGNMCVFCDAQ